MSTISILFDGVQVAAFVIDSAAPRAADPETVSRVLDAIKSAGTGGLPKSVLWTKVRNRAEFADAVGVLIASGQVVARRAPSTSKPGARPTR